jgi:hypothetical protein
MKYRKESRCKALLEQSRGITKKEAAAVQQPVNNDFQNGVFCAVRP